MIKDADETLQNLLCAELSDIHGCPIQQADQITFLSPSQLAENDSGKADADKTPRINLYLCHVQENVMLRNETFHRKSQVSERLIEITRPPARFDLSYLITVTGLDGTDEHELLGNVLGVLMRAPYVETKYLKPGLEIFGTNAMLLTVAQPDHLLMADVGKLWQALSAAPRPALSLVATVMFNPYVSKWTPVVLEAITGIGQGTGPEGPQHPLDRTTLRVSVAGIALDKATDRPVPGAVLTLDGRDETATSDYRGFFYLLNLPAGEYTAHVRHWRYAEYESKIIVPPPGQSNLLKPMEVKFQAPDDATVTTAVAKRETAQRNAWGLQEKGREATVSLAGRLYIYRAEEQESNNSDSERAPLPAANLVVRCGKSCTTTNSEGVYCFFDLKPDDREIIVETPGHEPETIWTRPDGFNGNVVPTQVLDSDSKGNVVPAKYLKPLPALKEVEEHKEKERKEKERRESKSQEEASSPKEPAETVSAGQKPGAKAKSAKI